MSDYIMYKKTEYKNDINYCKQFIFSFGSNYSLGTRLFPRQVREATIFFYSFLRYADELVDNPQGELAGQTHKNIDEFMTEWLSVIENGPTKESHPILRSNYWLFTHYKIPFDYTFDFLDAMKQDLIQTRYTSYQELEKYMWGSASIVGHVMTFIVGYTSASAFKRATSLAEAMQLANFLRDVDEDYQLRGRVYLPQREMLLFGVSEDMIAGQEMTTEVYNFILYYVAKTEQLFSVGIQGIKYLKKGKFSVLLASRMYRENIRILKKRNYDIFGPAIRLESLKKIWILCTTTALYLFRVLK